MSQVDGCRTMYGTYEPPSQRSKIYVLRTERMARRNLSRKSVTIYFEKPKVRDGDRTDAELASAFLPIALAACFTAGTTGKPQQESVVVVTGGDDGD